jgi:SAM-dependent methyltransferase
MESQMSFDQKYAEIYDALYSDKDYVAEAQYISRVLSEYLQAENPRLLEVGMGTGRHAEILLSLIEGSSIVGMEPSAHMAEQARDKGLTVVEADAQSGMSEFDADSLDAVLALFHVVSYITDPQELSNFFDEVARCMKPGGIFFFDVWHKPAVLHLGMTLRVKRTQLIGGREVVRIASPSIDKSRSIGTVHYEIFCAGETLGTFERIQEEHNLRFFEGKEVEELLGISGLRLEDSHEFLSGSTPSNETWGVSYIALKPY